MKTSREKCNRLTFERGLDTLVPAFLETLIYSLWVGPVAPRHEWDWWFQNCTGCVVAWLEKRESVCRLLGNLERRTEAPERNPGAQGTLWCTRIVVISTESLVFLRNRYFGLAVDIWLGKFSRAQMNIQFRSLTTESACIPTILVPHKVPWPQFPCRNRLKTFSYWLSSEHTALQTPKYNQNVPKIALKCKISWDIGPPTWEARFSPFSGVSKLFLHHRHLYWLQNEA